MYRRPLLRPGALAYRKALAEARADLDALNFWHECKLADLYRELAEVRAEFERLKEAVKARQKAEHELERLREMRRTWTAERGFGTPLH
jgi:hypothetical protein